ncbi:MULTISPECIES: ABC-F family ATP-binding cassette domain-containing protein [Aerococcus]|uniref:ABC-F family ATP-binding cassette domain-containing protein n=1 Tax=Aerococcus TaxID=1375 RepID=UPI0018A78135|nr:MULTISPECIES: ABC-F family ATP-binding cassette domain-containing protein [Aerococcus]MCY3038949.1 ABC-F family ATP-binding cassette domain-containing protein [Aerococcus sp. Group 2]MCY3040521.1 ABC-F family ATP-binding cassette domain-containing protein [Aerococcus sp. Group 2]MCY3042518.1 ABC-F family ATP-binding cassette domain-containing protein [Aerococcus sp. Group 2]MDK6519966.1 ABC-F family ATP-binding cassette domain-containing protein [Aerococcus urinae]
MQDYLAKNWSKTYGIKQLLDDVSFLIREGDHIALIGPNGSGKSTLLKILAGKDHLDSGTIEHSNDYSIGLVSQNPDLDDQQSLFEAVYSGDSPLVKTVKAYEQATQALSQDPNDEKKQKKFSHWESEMNRLDAWQLDTNIQTILTKLELKDLYQKVGHLSGGQKRRLGLAKVLIDEPDLLLLDEPTNHMDFEMVKWLENYINNYKKSVVIVTHDRYFLDTVAQRVFALDRGKMTEYQGNYQDYLNKRAVELDVEAANQAKQKKLYKQELAWMRQGAKARSTKQQARINRFNDLKEDLNQHRSLQGSVQLDFDQERLGKKVISLEDVSVGYDSRQPLLEDINLLIQNRDRIGIIGENGVGKTSLLNTIAGIIPPLSGQIEIGPTVKIAYFQQVPTDLPEDKRLINYISEVADEIVYDDGRKLSASQMLETFLFNRESHGQLIAKLSGGEKKRLYLLRLLMERPNVLFLDEPTNDLDIDTLTVLEDYLAEFPGAMLTVSHDRYFLDKTVDKLLIVHKDKSCQLFFGNFTDYEREHKEKAKSGHSPKQNPAQKSDDSPKSNDSDTNQSSKKRMTYKEKQDWQVIESQIDQLENDIQRIDNDMLANGSDYGKLSEWQKEKESKENDLLEKMEYWDYLSELKP